LLLIATLGVGVAATVATFAVVDAIVFHNLPWPAADRLGVVYASGIRPITVPARGGASQVLGTWSPPELSRDTWRRLSRSTTFEETALWTRPRDTKILAVVDGRILGRISTAHVSSTFFSILAVRPALGRLFRPDEDGPAAADTIILSDGVWRRLFGGRKDVVDTYLTLRVPGMGGASIGTKRVVGVLGEPFRFDNTSPDAFLPLGDRGMSQELLGIGLVRLAPGMSFRQAEAAAEAAEVTSTGGARSIRLVPLDADQLQGRRYPMLVVLATAGVLMLIVCANVSGLRLAELSSRAHERAVCAALGELRVHLHWRLAVEHLLLVAAGMVTGLLGAVWLIHLIVRFLPDTAFRVTPTVMSVPVAILSCVMASTVFGVLTAVPLWEIRRPLHVAALGSGGRHELRGTHRFQRGLAAVQIGLTLVLLTCAYLFGGAVLRLMRQPLGFDPSHVIVAATSFETMSHTLEDAPPVHAVVERLTALPGVVSADAAGTPPFFGEGERASLVTDDGQSALVEHRVVTGGYFSTIGMPILSGRRFTASDEDGPPVAVVSASFAREFFHGRPLGRQFSISGPITYSVIGVVPDVKKRALWDTDAPTFYALNGHMGGFAYFVARVAGDPRMAIASVRSAIGDTDSRFLIDNVEAMGDRITATFEAERVRGALATAFGGLALALAAVGLYGLGMRRVEDQRRELGIRAALGADPLRLFRSVVLDALQIVAVGVCVGAGAAWLAARVVHAVVERTPAATPFVYVLAVTVLVTAAVCASVAPALRASRADPVTVLKD
jgi:predicted permease